MVGWSDDDSGDARPRRDVSREDTVSARNTSPRRSGAAVSAGSKRSVYENARFNPGTGVDSFNFLPNCAGLQALPFVPFRAVEGVRKGQRSDVLIPKEVKVLFQRQWGITG